MDWNETLHVYTRPKAPSTLGARFLNFAPGGSGGAPKGAPQKSTSSNIIEFGVYQLVLMPTIHYAHSFDDPAPVGPLGAPLLPPKGPPKNQLHQMSSSLVSINSYWCLLFILSIHFMTRTPWGPGVPLRAPELQCTRYLVFWQTVPDYHIPIARINPFTELANYLISPNAGEYFMDKGLC